MSKRTYDKFSGIQDHDTDDERDSGYDREDETGGRGKGFGLRPSRKRRVEETNSFALVRGQDEDDDKSLEDPGSSGIDHDIDENGADPAIHPASNRTPSPSNHHSQSRLAQSPAHLKPTPKSPRQITSAARAAQKSGVLYLSRVPPFMKAATVKQLLGQHAPRHGIGRVFLTPEDSAAHARRVRAGGNRKKTFTDGWVEFGSKREAKIVAETLNGNLIGGRKGGFYHDDLWNLKYLRGFKWRDLTEQIAAENAERTARMRDEVRRSKKENAAFVRDVEKGKIFETREEKRRARVERGEVDAIAVSSAAREEPPVKTFKQNRVRGEGRGDDAEQDVGRLARLGRMIL